MDRENMQNVYIWVDIMQMYIRYNMQNIYIWRESVQNVYMDRYHANVYKI